MKTAEDTRVKAVCTWAAISNVDYFWNVERIEEVRKNGVIYYYNGRTKQNLPLYLAYYEDIVKHKDRIDIEKACENIQVPMLVTHGEGATAVPIANAKEILSWQSQAQHFFIKEAGHTFGGYEPYEKKELPIHAQLLCDKTRNFLNNMEEL